jgi:hypothetical protein
MPLSIAMVLRCKPRFLGRQEVVGIDKFLGSDHDGTQMPFAGDEIAQVETEFFGDPLRDHDLAALPDAAADGGAANDCCDNLLLRMASLVLCYAAEDEKTARALGSFLEANLTCEVCYEEGVVRPGFDLVDAAERGLSAEAALVLLSPDSVPKPWRREKWQPVFFSGPALFQTHLGFVLVRECHFPDLLRRQRFFNMSRDFTGAVRQIARWLLRPDQPAARELPLPPELGDLRITLADRPGTAHDVPAGQAGEFARLSAADFEAVYRIQCRNRSWAGILGDAGHAMGIRLAGNVEENLGTLIAKCRNHRYLFIFENLRPADREGAAFGGRSSAIFVTPDAAESRVPLDEIGAAFFTAPRDEARCAEMLGDASAYMSELFASDYEAGLRIGWALVSILKSAGRFAETVEVLDVMENAARLRSDSTALFKIHWEQSWLRDTDQDGAIGILSTAASEIVQLRFDFA